MPRITIWVSKFSTAVDAAEYALTVATPFSAAITASTFVSTAVTSAVEVAAFNEVNKVSNSFVT